MFDKFSLYELGLTPHNYLAKTNAFINALNAKVKTHFAIGEKYVLKVSGLKDEPWFNECFVFSKELPSNAELHYSFIKPRQLTLYYNSGVQDVRREVDFNHSLAKLMWCAMKLTFQHNDCNCLNLNGAESVDLY